MIKFDNVSLEIDGCKILHGVDLKVRGGEFVALIGSSGAGKSSLFRILIGDYKPTSGKITVDGVDISELNSKYLQYYRRKIGMVFQDFKLLPKKTVAENVAFAPEVCEEPGEKIDDVVSEVLELVGLTSKANHFPLHLSGGEQQRVAIARALAHRAALLIADEPTGNLDRESAKEVIKLLEKVNNQGVTVMLTTHQPDLLNHIKTVRRVYIEKGRIVG